MRTAKLIAIRARARRRRTAKRRTLATALALVGVLVAAVGAEGLNSLDYYTSDLPDPSSLNPQDLAQATQILDRGGRLLYLRHGAEIRTVVPLVKISPWLRKATIDLEDRNFFEHHGLDYGRLLGAAYANLVEHQVQGGSTITQQLVKLKYLTSERSFDRKVKEALLAGELEDRYSKDSILEAYLNAIFYGHQVYGAEAASQRYFGKHAAELDLGEATLLAGIPEEPTILDPLTPQGLALCRQRQKLVLEAMANLGDITDAQALETEARAVHLNPQVADKAFFAPHFVAFVLDYLRRQYGSALVDGGGLKVTTTLDLDLQQKAESIVNDEVARFAGGGVNNGAMVAVNPNTGEILAYVGSADYNNDAIDGKVDNVTNRGGVPRQPGSSFKPYVYITALADGYTPSSQVNDTQGDYGGTFFHDFDNRSEGTISVRRALVESRNIPAIQLMQKLTPQRVIQTARTFGITTPLRPELGTAIGTSEVHMLEHASGYGVFATEGIYRPAAPVLKIEDASGSTIFRLKDTGRRVVSPALAYVLDDILLGYAKQWGLNLIGPAAGKSGTTDDGADLWYMGYTPDLVVGAWMAHTGHNRDGSGIGRFKLPGLFGVTTAAYMFKDFLPVYYSGRKIPEFPRPPGVVGGTTSCAPAPAASPTPQGEPPPPLRCSTSELRIEGP